MHALFEVSKQIIERLVRAQPLIVQAGVDEDDFVVIAGCAGSVPGHLGCAGVGRFR